ncbi:MAG: hypothetical protein IPL46_22065 [Saprospiraceae bacterium]|nr:hypothetical protein [Saprospiraceae bacterium]
MMRTIVLLLCALIYYSCLQQKSIGGQYKTSLDQLPKSRTGLKIETTPTRGTAFTDSLGSEYFIVHVTNIISNDSTVPIQLQIDLPLEFSYPISGNYVNYKIILWPDLTEPPRLYSDRQGRVQVMKNWTISDWDGSNQFNRILAPGEKYVVTIGTLVNTRAPNICGAVAYSLLTYSERRNYSDCNWMLDENHLANPQLALGLQVGFCTSGQHYESCKIITCGQITYVEN